jgi:hypothetical protein
VIGSGTICGNRARWKARWVGDVPAESIHPAFLMCDAWIQNEIGLEQTKVEYAKGDLCESMWVGGWMSGWMDGGV